MRDDWCPACGKDHPLPWYQQVIVWLGWMEWNDRLLEAMEGQ